MDTPHVPLHRFTRLAIVGVPVFLLSILVPYVALVVLPFFRHGLLWQASRIARRAADPHNFTPFAWDGSGQSLYTIALALAWFSPLLVAALMGSFGLIVSWNRQHLSARSRKLTSAILLLGLGALLFMCTIGLGIATWLLD